MQSILWCAWPPSGRSSTLKIACGMNIDISEGIPHSLLTIYIFFKNQLLSIHSNFVLRVVVYASALHQKNFIKIGHRT